MQLLFKALLEILMHRQGPEDLPASGLLLAMMLAAYVAVGLTGLMVAGLFSDNLTMGLLEVAVDVSILCLWFTLLLRLFGLGNRLGQTLTAALGTLAILGMLFLPVAVLILKFEPAADPAGPASPAMLVGLTLYLALLIWTASVLGHITARALDTAYATGLGLSVLYLVLDFTLIRALFPLAQ